MLATDLVAHAPDGVEVHARTQAQLDLLDPAQVERALDEVRPDWVVNAAAYTAVDRAETERDMAFVVNATAVGSLARACARRDMALVHFGTDYVFPGDGARPYREDDPVAPVNAYGESKLAGERAIADSAVRATVIRTQWLFGAAGKSFPRTMWERATRGERTRVVDDQRGRPTYTVDLAAVTWELAARSAFGVFHAANQGAVTWFELAAHVFERAGARELLSPCSTADYPTPARRPAFSVLDTSKLERTIGRALPPWTSAVDRFLDELAGAPVRSVGSPASG
jgi:dTDP-4-dehydrorhamnose reductase